ncbi:hypothetical protein LTR37_009039 [Vermiconidia calcicola]|uniref:Uncharacterized protein n=1 Tax=Vermiconidia calcicola TaxID=1690605 RepID=A0ACC3N8Y8_9PEZI|nr:hypothetical protein LTR37_009039 [Vermiconidia calcicola]
MTMQTRNQLLDSLVPLTMLPAEVDDECAICYEELVNPVQIQCKHVYCSDCITKWLTRRNKNTCPQCRHVLFELDETDRGPVGDNRLRVIAQAMELSRLMTDDGFDLYNDQFTFPNSAVHRAAAVANGYLAGRNATPQVDDMVIEFRRLGPHIISMGNLLRGYAQATGRPYSGYQRRDWRLIIDRLMTLLDLFDGQVRHQANLGRVVNEYRVRLEESLIQDLIDVHSGRFFEQDVQTNSPSGDLDVLLRYVFVLCVKIYKDREKRREELRQAQELALQSENTRVGRALRWTGQRLFGGV